MTTSLRLARLLAVVVWVGGLIFFAFMLAPTAFHVLPVRQAGLVVGGALRVFHPVALLCGVVSIGATLKTWAQANRGAGRRLGAELALAGIMFGTTLYLGTVLPAMERDQALAGGDVNAVALDNPARMDFDRLHRLSERAEGGVLVCGLVLVGVMAGEKG